MILIDVFMLDWLNKFDLPRKKKKKELPHFKICNLFGPL